MRQRRRTLDRANLAILDKVGANDDDNALRDGNLSDTLTDTCTRTTHVQTLAERKVLVRIARILVLLLASRRNQWMISVKTRK